MDNPYICDRRRAAHRMARRGVTAQQLAHHFCVSTRRIESWLSHPEPPETPRRDREWENQAACANYDPNLWQPRTDPPRRRAKKICNTECVVRQQCLDYALANEIKEGIMGGLSWPERKLLLKGDVA